MNTKPLFTLLLSLIGAILSVYLTYRLAMRAVPKARKAYEDWAGSKDKPASAAPEGAQPTSGRVLTLSAHRIATSKDELFMKKPITWLLLIFLCVSCVFSVQLGRFGRGC